MLQSPVAGRSARQSCWALGASPALGQRRGGVGWVGWGWGGVGWGGVGVGWGGVGWGGVGWGGVGWGGVVLQGTFKKLHNFRKWGGFTKPRSKRRSASVEASKSKRRCGSGVALVV